MIPDKKYSLTCGDEIHLKNYHAKLTYGWGIRHLQMACMCAGFVVLFVARSSMGVAVLAMTNKNAKGNVEIFDWDKTTQGLILSSFFWGYLVMQIPGGLMAKRFGGKPVMFASLLSNGIICLAIPTLVQYGGWPLMCMARVAMGLTQACLFPTTHTLVGRWLPANERTTYSGIVFGGGTIGIIISMPLSGFLADTQLGWKLIFYFCSVILLAFSAVWWCFAASSPAEHRMIGHAERAYIEFELTQCKSYKSLETPWKAIFTSKKFWAVCSAHLGCTIYFTFFFVDLPAYLEKGLQLSLKNSAILSALPYIGTWFGSLVATNACDKLVNNGFISLTVARKIFNSIAYCGVAVSLCGLYFVGPGQSILAVTMLVTALTLGGAIYAGFMVTHLDLSPNFAGVMLSLTNTFANIGSVFTPLLISYILKNDAANLERWKIVFLVIAFLTVLSNLVYVAFSKSTRQPWDDPNFNKNLQGANEENMKPILKNKEEEQKQTT